MGKETAAATPVEVEGRDMVQVAAGEFTMGSDNHYPEEAPTHRVRVDGFWIDRHPVTNRQYAAFVSETGYSTVAERPLDPADYPGVAEELLVPGSLVFHGTPGPVPLHDPSRWWDYVPGAQWREPLGSESQNGDLADHPVTQVAYEDAKAYAEWAGASLPTEAEWEYAARGGLEGATFTWGDEDVQDTEPLANTWQGGFPYENSMLDGWMRTSPVGSFPPNGYGLVDMAGNVWEWTEDWFVPRHPSDPVKACCTPENPRGPKQEESFDPKQPQIRIPRKVVKGGSHLCSPSYCLRYRPAARSPEMIDTATSNIGFRCVVRG